MQVDAAHDHLAGLGEVVGDLAQREVAGRAGARGDLLDRQLQSHDAVGLLLRRHEAAEQLAVGDVADGLDEALGRAELRVGEGAEGDRHVHVTLGVVELASLQLRLVGEHVDAS